MPRNRIGGSASAEENAKKIAALLSGALPGGYEIRTRLTAAPMITTSLRGNAFKAKFEMYRKASAATLWLVLPVADGGWRRTPKKAYEALLREFGSMRRVRYMNEKARLTVCFPAAESPEELELLLAVEGCSLIGENSGF